MLAEAHWEGATEAAGDRHAGRKSTPSPPARPATRRAELDEDAERDDTTDWFDQQPAGAERHARPRRPCPIRWPSRSPASRARSPRTP